MKHLGDITQIRGSGIEPVDCITGGSPCQDLSQAGKRAGIAGERSGLFMEQIRIVKEMREHERSAGRTGIMVRPRYMVWENVPGAFSSNKGEDFATVLEETIRIAEPEAPSVPVPENGWPTAGILHDEMGAWSVAWRVHDAQFWGVPQRRRRIALVADFGGMSAPEILFERKSLPGYLAQGRWTWKASSGCFAPGIMVPNQEKPCRDGISYGKVGAGSVRVYENHRQANRIKELGETCCTVTAIFGTGGNNQQLVCSGFNGHKSTAGSIQYQAEKSAPIERNMPPNVIYGFSAGQGAKSWGIGWEKELVPTMRSSISGTNRSPCLCIQGNVVDRRAVQNGTGIAEDTAYTINSTDRHCVCMATGQANAEIMTELAPALNCNHEQPIIGPKSNLTPGESQARRIYSASGKYPSLPSREKAGGNQTAVLTGAVRRLTPLECERLQGYPDGWTDIPETEVNGKKVKASDSARYKALGNSIALPFWTWMFERMSGYLPHNATMGSLFDGIGGFPLCWERIHGKGTARWASEIEPFCLAVSKRRLGE
nr:MAG TPA: Cytosine specific methyltransferase [Caudoviricetes sp.]